MRKRFLAIGFACAGMFFLMIFMTIGFLGDTVHYPYLSMEDGWRLRGTIRNAQGVDEHIEMENMKVSELPRGSKGDYIQVSAELPDMGDIPFPTLVFETRYAAYEVSVDGIVVDRYDTDAIGTRKFVGSSYHFVTLPEEYVGKYVTLTIHRTENRAGKALGNVYIGAHEDMESMLLHENFFALGCGFFLIVFGLSFMFLTLIYLSRVPELLAQLVGSTICAVLGMLLITNDHVSFLFMNADVGTTIDYMAIYALLPLGYLLLEALHVEHRIPTRVYRGFAGATILAVFAIYALHFLNVVHMNRLLFVYYAIVVVGMFIMLLDVIKNVKEKKLTPVAVVTLLGLSALIICLFLNMANFVLWRAGASFLDRETGRNFIPLGAMIFAASQIVNYLSFISESGTRQKDYASLQNIAYADTLTGLANRARADKIFEELDRSREDYCLVSVDVNGLKDTNDRLGHAAGDRLLREYAQALKANFGDEELCARMGGDEFLVVMKRTNADGFGVRLRRLYNDLDEMNERDKTLFRSAAIGYAFRHECHGGDAHTVYLLADERMFENKREQHIRYRIKERV
ncbi:MAG: GGDEF domain-containing protein [Lachnospiraceae bacterium]|nr:GGDEF domain-containing protein [Lachnospiraceae bacterium]